MMTTLGQNQNVQVQSFWNLIQNSDEKVQKELYILLQNKYEGKHLDNKEESTPFLKLQGVLKGKGSQETDRVMLDEFMKEKYGV